MYIPDEIDDDEARKVKVLLVEVNNVCVRHSLALLILTTFQRVRLPDAATKNAFQKFDAAVCKKWAAVLSSYDEEDYKKMEALNDLHDFINELIPEGDDDEDEEPTKRRGGQKR